MEGTRKLTAAQFDASGDLSQEDKLPDLFSHVAGIYEIVYDPVAADPAHSADFMIQVSLDGSTWADLLASEVTLTSDTAGTAVNSFQFYRLFPHVKLVGSNGDEDDWAYLRVRE